MSTHSQTQSPVEPTPEYEPSDPRLASDRVQQLFSTTCDRQLVNLMDTHNQAIVSVMRQ